MKLKVKVPFIEKLEEKNKNNIETSAERKKKRKNRLNNIFKDSKKKLKIEKRECTNENVKDDSNIVNQDYQNINIFEMESDKFNGKFLRNSFNSTDGINMLNKFVIYNENSNKDIAAEYLQAGGSVLEILRLLDISEKNINNTCIVFSAVHIIILKILAKYPKHQTSAGEACHHLINTHIGSIHSMLSRQSKAKHRKIVLKLLCAIVSLGGKLPRELLNCLSLHSELLEILVSHSKPTDRQSVRTCFIHFILAFLIEGNASVVRALLEKYEAFSYIFHDLIYDYSDIVQFVLKTVKKYILENSVISKTIKLHIFSSSVIQNIFNLYNWKGPYNWPGQNDKKEKLMTEHINQEQKEIVIECLNEFLLTLLTSTRHGIVFHDRSLGMDSKYKRNHLLITILQNLDKPWENDKQEELIIQILTACPDVIKSQLISAESFLVPKVSKEWFSIIHFISKIISNIDINNCLNLCSADLTEIQLINAMLNIILPSIVTKNAVIPSLKHSSFSIHHEIIKLVLIMIKKVKNLIFEFETTKFNICKKFLFKNIIRDYIFKHMPSFESILNIWIQSLSQNLKEQNEDNSNVNLKDHLLAILNLLEVYCDICPDIFLMNFTNKQKESIVMLTSLHNLQNITSEELITMKVKAIKILLFSNISGILPNEEIFSEILSFLITQIGSRNIAFNLEISQTIHLLLSKCGIFEEYNDQIEIWIDGISYLKIHEKQEVADWITKMIKHVFKYSEKYTFLILELEKNIEEIIDINIQENIFNDMSKRNIEDVKLDFSILPVTSISLLLYDGIENLKKHPSDVIERYMSIVLVHFLHYQISLKSFISLVEKLEIPMQKYFRSWLDNKILIPRRKPFKSSSIYQTISQILLNSNETYKINVNETQLSIEIDNNIMNFTLSDFEIKAIFRMVIFYLTQLLQKINAELLNTEMYTTILISLLIIADKKEIISGNLTNYCAKWIFKHPIFLQYFKGIYINHNATETMITVLFIKICRLFFDWKKQFLIFQFMNPYQNKFVTEIKSIIKKQKTNDLQEVQVYDELIELLQLNIKVSIDLLSTIMNLSKEIFLTSNKFKLSIWNIIVHKLLEQFFSEEANTESSLFITLNENLLKKLFYYWIELKDSYKQEMDLWGNSFYKYLLTFPHSISVIDEEMFTAIIKTNLTLTIVKILKLLVERNDKFITTFIKYTNNNEDILQNKSFIFSMLSSNLNYKWNEGLLNKIYNIYKTSIVRFLTELESNEYPWIFENIDAVSFLIDNTFDPIMCKKICDVILSNGNKLDGIKIEHVKLFNNLFKKSSKIKSDALKDFVQMLLYVTVTSLKKDSKNVKKLNFFCKTIIDSINVLKLDNNFTFEELTKNNFWYQFIRISLKLGLKISKENNIQIPFLLKTLTVTCDTAYKDNNHQNYVKTIFEMTTSHSEFIKIMLSSESIKSDLTELLWTLIKKNYSIMLITHVPLYLASYNATLAKSDQFILKILQHYENNEIKLNNYRPYLWSSAATEHYNVKKETDTVLWRQPTIFQVLDILDQEIVNNTIKNFPINRNLKDDFTNTISTIDQVYDPAFYLPVFRHLLADNNVVACHKIIHSGTLALAIIACSSLCKEVRLAAFTVISRFYIHLEATSSKEKLLWMHFINFLRNGIFKTELPIENVRINGFIAIFLARTSFVMTQPLNPLYSTLQTFLMAKPVLNLNTIPELLQLYYSSEIEYRAHRYWILEIICDGLKNNYDMDIALKYVLFKMLFDFYTCTLSDLFTKNLILQIVKSATRLPKPCLILVNGYALLPWLNTITENLNKGDIQSITYIIDIVNNILFAFHETKSKDIHNHLMLSKILLCLSLSFSQNLTIECLKNFIDVLNKTIINKSVCNIFTKEQINYILKCGKRLSQDISKCEAILQFGCKFVKKIFFKYETNLSFQESLLKLIITWHNYMKNN